MTVQRHLWLLGAAARPSTAPRTTTAHQQQHARPRAQHEHLRSAMKFIERYSAASRARQAERCGPKTITEATLSHRSHRRAPAASDRIGDPASTRAYEICVASQPRATHAAAGPSERIPSRTTEQINEDNTL